MPCIILYTFPGSPWGGKVATYLKLRDISFSECHQPMMWPRPDVELLGIRYRRIPFLAIGRDLFFDSRLIIDKIEDLFPGTPLGAVDLAQQAVQSLLQDWAETSVLPDAIATLPVDLPVFSERLIQDRLELWGVDFSTEARAQRRPDALAQMRNNYMLLENLLSDGRKWILGTNSISLGDIHAAFILTYIANVPGSLPEAVFNSDQFPHAMLYLARYQDATRGTHGAATPTLSGKEAAQIIRQAGFLEHSSNLTADSTELSIGQPVRVWRTDDISSAVKHFDSGKLLGLSSQEVIISSFTPEGNELHLHFPRRNTRVVAQL